MGGRAALVAAGIVLIVAGVAAGAVRFERIATLAPASMTPDSGHAYAIVALPVPPDADVAGDDNAYPARSHLRVFEQGAPLGPAHTLHVEIRGQGKGRYSHWGPGLLFSASDNSDPRTNGRAYSVGYTVGMPPVLGWVLAIVGAGLILHADRRGIASEFARALAGIEQGLRALRGAHAVACLRRHWPLALLFMVLAGLAAALGMERSGWILITQPVEPLAATNSLLGYSWIREGGLLHKENHSSFVQVAFFLGADTLPDMYFRRPVYTVIAAFVSIVAGVAAALWLVNVAAWGLAIWLCHRFTRAFYSDEAAARWAALLATAGIGFVVHALDYSAHLLAFTFYMAGVVLIYESQVWRRAAGLRTHLAIGIFLAIACLQYNSGLALTAAYVTVAIRHNKVRHVVPVTLLALAAQPAWGIIVAGIFQERYGVPLHDLAGVEREYFERAIASWREKWHSPIGELTPSVLRYLASFATFEMPLVVIVGGARLLAGLRDRASRPQVCFALPFIAFPVAAAMVFAPAAFARGYLIYGISIFFFAGCGAALAALVRRNRAVFLPVAVLAVAGSVLWSTAHFVNALGPAKAYFLGIESGYALFAPRGWEAASLTGAEPTPRIFGGSRPLADAGLSREMPELHSGANPRFGYALLATALFIGLFTTALLVRGMGWRTAGTIAGALILVQALAVRSVDTRVAAAVVERVLPIESAVSLEYEVRISEAVRQRLVGGLRQGRVVALFPAFHNGKLPPHVHLDDRPVRLEKKIDRMNWLIQPGDLLAALEARGEGRLRVTFEGESGGWLGGWQRDGLAGRALARNGVRIVAPVVPAVELRLLENIDSMTPVFVAF